MKSLPPDTPEQALITNFSGSQLVVVAFAGTGKTTTLIKYALNNPNYRMLYIAYNRTVRDEAAAKFPKNVECKTSHQLAYASIGKQYQHKQKNNLSFKDIGQALNEQNWEIVKDVLQTLNHFLASIDEEILLGHTPIDKTPKELTEKELEYKKQLVAKAKMIWGKMTDVNDPFPMIHDGYLKLYQLSKPDLSLYYGAILLDEAQDANPVISSFVLRQRCIVIFVGDKHQQIYRFRGAENALDVAEMKAATRLYLTNSFRFGPRVAMIANAILALKEEHRSVIGRGKPDSVSIELPETAYPRAILHRTVMACINTGLEAAEQGKKIYWAGGIEGYQITDILDLYYLSIGSSEKIKNKKLLQEYTNYTSYIQIAKQTKSFEMLRAISVLNTHTDKIHDLIIKLQQNSVEEESEADITISTAHRSKGLEWDYVVLADDFPDILQLKDHKDAQESYEDELNLIYVAATRAMKSLAINATVESVLRYHYRQISNDVT